jgi:hypothetical protein
MSRRLWYVKFYYAKKEYIFMNVFVLSVWFFSVKYNIPKLGGKLRWGCLNYHIRLVCLTASWPLTTNDKHARLWSIFT